MLTRGERNADKNVDVCGRGNHMYYQSKPWFGGFRSTLDIVSSTWEPDGLGILYQIHLSSCEHPQDAVTCWTWNISHDPQQAQLSGLLSLKEHYCVVKRLNHWMLDWKVFWVNCLMRLILCIREVCSFWTVIHVQTKHFVTLYANTGLYADTFQMTRKSTTQSILQLWLWKSPQSRFPEPAFLLVSTEKLQTLG